MTINIDPADQIIDTPFGDALGERYLSYALSTIMARSLPDVRDGMKPVHRRLLYAMRLLKLDPEAGFKKCARVVGDVIGKYHPHGDQSVYDALVRLAQDFSVRYPLVDGQGNFGNVDGDNAAAMRYTEARLTAVAGALMEGLDEDSVDFRETYDGEDREPVVFPANFPNLLANGATGIAVGMATSIPPHNVDELCAALSHLVDARLKGRLDFVTAEKLAEFVTGPDFPTGGTIIEPRQNIIEAYETGRGAFRLRANWLKEETGRGGYQIVVHEIPYQVQKSRLIEKIAELISDRKPPILADIRDESTEDVRIVLEPRARTVEPDVLMESLYKMSDLEVRISLNMNVLDKGREPKVMSLKDVLLAFLDHRMEVLIRRARYRLGKIDHRLEVLGGYLIAYLNLDEVIRIIREEDDAKQSLMERFELTEVQAEAILNMRLRSLRKLEEIELRKEHKALNREGKELKTLLKDEILRWDRIEAEIAGIRTKFGKETALGRRRTLFGEAPVSDNIPLEAMIEKEPVTIICSKMGWIRAMKGHLAETEDIKFKEGDEGRFRFHASTTDRILLFASNGRFYTLAADKLPGGRGHGEPVRLMIDLDAGDDVVALMPYQAGAKLIVASTDGKGFVVETDKVIAATRNGKQVMNVSGRIRAAICRPAEGDSVAVVGDNRKLLIFSLAELPVMTRGRGVLLQRYKDGGLSDLTVFNRENGLSWTMGGAGNRTRTETDLLSWEGKRGNAGRLPPTGFPRNNKFG